MLRVIHGNHRPKELIEFRGERGDVRTLATAPEFGVAAHGPDVFVFGECVVARPRGEIQKRHFVKEFDRGLAAQRCEG